MTGEPPLRPLAPDPEGASPLQTVRTGTNDDLDIVMTIMTAAFSSAYGEGWTRSQCAGIMPMAGVCLRLLGEAGFALSRMVAGEAELLLIAVDPARQGHGVGHALLEDFVEQARQAGAHRLHLEVRDGNPAMHIYRRAGFSPAGRRRDYYRGLAGDRYDALTLVRDI